MTPAGDAITRRVAGIRWLPRMPRPASPGAVLAAGAVALIVAIPLIALFVIASRPAGEVWPHLFGTVLPRSTQVTLTLMLGVGLASAVVGVGTAWLATMCRFPGRWWLEGALVLPLAVPTYIVAYCYAEIFGYIGPVQGAIRAIFGFETARDYWFPEIRSLPGLIFVLTAVLYPYVYMTTRLLFLMQSSAALDVARTLGCGPFRMFFRVALPLARPAIAVGVSLALMETLNDIGAVEFFGVRTLTFAVYDTWLNRGSLAGAAQLALVLLFLVFALILAERIARGRQRYHVNSRCQQPLAPFYLSGWKAGAASLACLLPVFFGFVLPAALLVDYSSRRLDQFLSPQLLSAAINSLTVAAATAVLAVAAGLMLAYAARLSPSRLVWGLGRFASIGYAVPGTVLAVGILIPFAAFDNWLDAVARNLFGVSTGLLLAGSGAVIVYACTVRFLAVSTGSLEAGLAKISGHLDMAARTLRRTPGQTLTEIHLPLMRSALATAALLVFVDTMKELSATILLRPFDFDTLATFVYSQASRAAFEDASVAALAIVIVGILPLILLLRAGNGRRVAGIRA
jgi:iron(III) transport system permease protein